MDTIKPQYQFYGPKLKKIRKSRNMTVSEFAALLNRSPRTIGSWERNERRPSSSDIKIMADILGIDTHLISDLKDLILFDNKKSLAENVLSTEDRIHSLFETNLNIEQKAFIYKLLGVFKNITKTVELTKKENERLILTIDSVPAGIYFKDPFQHYKIVNKHFSYIVGKTINEIVGKTDQQILQEKLLNPIKKIEDKVIQTGKPVYYSQVIFDDLNYKKYYAVSVVPVNEGESNITSVIGCISDISERMNALKNYKLLEHVINHIAVALWVRYRKPIPHFVFLNSAVHEIYGRSLKDFNNDPELWIKLVHPDDKLKVKTWSDSIIHDANNNFTESKAMIYRIIHVDGTVKYIIDKRSRFINEEGELLDFGSLKEITKQDAERISANQGKK